MRKLSVIATALLVLTACGRSEIPSPTTVPSTANVRSDLPMMTVHKNASCGCCKAWINHLRSAGFTVDARDIDNLGPIKERVGVPPGMGSCHTAEIGGYFIEGHVPAEDIKRMLAEHPAAKGLVVPAMPIGSPGMESPSQKAQPYDVFIIGTDGAKSVYAHHGD